MFLVLGCPRNIQSGYTLGHLSELEDSFRTKETKKVDTEKSSGAYVFKYSGKGEGPCFTPHRSKWPPRGGPSGPLCSRPFVVRSEVCESRVTSGLEHLAHPRLDPVLTPSSRRRTPSKSLPPPKGVPQEWTPKLRGEGAYRGRFSCRERLRAQGCRSTPKVDGCQQGKHSHGEGIPSSESRDSPTRVRKTPNLYLQYICRDRNSQSPFFQSVEGRVRVCWWRYTDKVHIKNFKWLTLGTLSFRRH